MKIEMKRLEEMIEHTKMYKKWLENTPAKPEEQLGKDVFLRQMDSAIKNFTKELGGENP